MRMQDSRGQMLEKELAGIRLALPFEKRLIIDAAFAVKNTPYLIFVNQTERAAWVTFSKRIMGASLFLQPLFQFAYVHLRTPICHLLLERLGKDMGTGAVTGGAEKVVG